MRQINIAVLVSGHGRGSNLQAIIDACNDGRITGKVAVVIGVKDDAPAMERARSQGISTVAIRSKDFDSDEAYGARILEVLAEHEIALVCLAGYMRILPSSVVSAYRHRIMNIHPALIPLFCGTGMFGERVHQAAVDYGVKVSGCTVHFVDEGCDTGPIIIQAAVPVLDDDTEETLSARILEQEHRIYPEAIRLFSEGKLKIEGRRVKFIGT